MGEVRFTNQYKMVIRRTTNYEKGKFYLVSSHLDDIFVDIKNPTAFRLYLYYLKNADGYTFGDGPVYFNNSVNQKIDERTFREARKILVNKGYITAVSDKVFIFHEFPVGRELFKESGSSHPKVKKNGSTDPNDIKSGGVDPNTLESGLTDPQNEDGKVSGLVDPNLNKNGLVDPKTIEEKESGSTDPKTLKSKEEFDSAWGLSPNVQAVVDLF